MSQVIKIFMLVLLAGLSSFASAKYENSQITFNIKRASDSYSVSFAVVEGTFGAKIPGKLMEVDGDFNYKEDSGKFVRYTFIFWNQTAAGVDTKNPEVWKGQAKLIPGATIVLAKAPSMELSVALAK
ncbi:hypothetical protein [Microbulbifer aggregans]|uniref:hypothetical protein n=1 Tax=Microbulbifer aggregans TaxID=1769779 RepID=UPI001CFE4014|nr:hypothetical protein [Microbulbifer aggregans]